MPGSKQAARAAIQIALTETREEEMQLKKALGQQGIKAAAVDFGGEFLHSAVKVVERAIVAAKREGVIKDTHADEGAIAGATREALSQLMPKALGFNVGGKIGIARIDDHISVAVFFGIGLVHLDEVAIGLGHRAVP
ncbi:MAG TPA: hut operon positive regulator HutP [Clostridia bacterium]|nr:hut operon positive regulator HutP [Clostridia bacterium]